ncbi:MAG TPA: lysophospholipid acyltransferase family protein [Thermoanaerobaculia bacterium]|jgi:1-acyl-sn-glycerol-3-phosphate acyltransferase|nr:lysophospholipid acyltransferase family protein [Thermoanaerobaculia bacterium]
MDEADKKRPPESRQERSRKANEVSPLLVSLFGGYSERHLARHFNTLRLSKAQRPDLVAARGKPLIIYLNHPSWWDPLICLQLAAHLFPDRRHYGPIDAGINRYRFFERMGFIGVDPATARGARRFLTLSREILSRPDSALWIPAEGRFTDPRERPVRVRSGIGHLAARARQAVLLPLALEVPFWEEQLPEILARFGEEIPTGDAGMGASDWTAVLEDALDAALEALATESLAREPARFDVLLGGGAAGGGISDVWRRFRARLAGEPA